VADNTATRATRQPVCRLAAGEADNCEMFFPRTRIIG